MNARIFEKNCLLAHVASSRRGNAKFSINCQPPILYFASDEFSSNSWIRSPRILTTVRSQSNRPVTLHSPDLFFRPFRYSVFPPGPRLPSSPGTRDEADAYIKDLRELSRSSSRERYTFAVVFAIRGRLIDRNRADTFHRKTSRPCGRVYP